MDDNGSGGCAILGVFLLVFVAVAVLFGLSAADEIKKNEAVVSQQITLQERERTAQIQAQERGETERLREREDAKTERFQSYLVAINQATGFGVVPLLCGSTFLAFLFGAISTFVVLLRLGRHGGHGRT